MSPTFRPAWRCLAAAAAMFAVAGLTAASAAAAPVTLGPAPAPAASSPVPTPAHPLTPGDVEAFLDGLVPAALNASQTPGAVVVVVKDGQVLYEKGYGYADWAKGTAVVADRTLFRPGSVSKLFTWTAVMQQVQAGKLDLDADVNRYLDFRIPAFHGIPVTLRMLMTHRAGFSETARDLLVFDKAPAPLDQVMKTYVPPRIFAPNDGPGYSNYGASLAGYIVQRVSGEPFDAYVQRHIFTPLGMAHSTFDQPLPANLKPDMSKGYVTWSQPGPGYEVVAMAPAGALASTGDDMARFMIAHLQDGRYGGAQILSPQVAQEMHDTIWKAFPDLNGNALGFYRHDINGHRVIAHGGDTVFFHSELTLFLDDHVGLFVSVNGRGKDGQGAMIREHLFEGFADRYFPAAAQPPASSVDAATAKAHAAMLAGNWIDTRRSDSTFLAVIGLLMPTKVVAGPDGTVSVVLPFGPRTFVEQRPFLWRERNGHDRLEATVQNGRITRWGTDSIAPIEVWVRPGPLVFSGLALPLAGLAMLVLALTAVIWPIGVLARRRYGGAFAHAGARAHAYRLVRLFAWLAVISLIVWMMVVSAVSSTMGAPVQLLLHAAQALSLLAFVGGAIAALWNLVLSFSRGGSLWSRIFAVLLVAAFGWMLYLALGYHLIGFGSNY